MNMILKMSRMQRRLRMNTRVRLATAVCAGVLLTLPVVGIAVAQDETPATTDPLALPDLTPREIEIRGDLVISFPSLERQPLIGFNPPPRIPEIAPDRRPYVSEYKQTSDDLPDSPLQRPTPPSVTALSGGERAYAEAEVTTGNYFNRTARLRTGYPLAESTRLELDVDYSGSNGNEVLDGFDTILNEFDSFDGRLDLRHGSSKFSGSVTVKGFSDTFNLYPVGTVATAPSYTIAPDRQINSFGGGFSLGTGTASKVRVKSELMFDQTLMETDMESAGTIDESLLTRTEQSGQGSISVTVPTGTSSIVVDGLGAINRLDSGEADEEQNMVVSGGARYRALIGNSLELSAGGRVMSIAIEDTETRRATYVAPSVRLTVSPNPWVDIYVQNDPKATNNTLSSVTRTNPYLIDQPLLEPTIYPVNAEAGVKVYSGQFRIVGRAGYRDSPNFSYFRKVTTAEIAEATGAFTSIGYAEASVLSGGGDISVALPGRLSVTVGGAYRYAQFENSSDPVPYFAPVTGSLSVSYSTPNNKLLLQAGTEYLGERFVDRSESAKLDDQFNVNFSGVYNVTTHLGVAVRAENLLSDDLETWENYRQSPVRIAAGLRLLW